MTEFYGIVTQYYGIVTYSTCTNVNFDAIPGLQHRLEFVYRSFGDDNRTVGLSALPDSVQAGTFRGAI
ncbi:hypothetical protein PI124_g22945 [Phytophthora idaei]|nr:hypothetical protein PI124_g22945 [Phytophthora idaei]